MIIESPESSVSNPPLRAFVVSISRTVQQWVDITIYTDGDEEEAKKRALEMEELDRCDADGLHWKNDDVTYVSVDWVRQVK